MAPLDMARAHYFHLELDRHDILLAEELPAESYLDTGNRAAFANGPGPTTLHPAFHSARAEGSCAPLHESGPEVAAVRAGLLARLAAQGWTRAAEPGLHLRLGTRLLLPMGGQAGWQHFVLPSGGPVHVLSRAGVPAELEAASDDRRRLGVAIEAVRMNGRFLPLTSAALRAGFYALERQGAAAWRWTDGAALLDLPRSRAIVLDLLIRAALPGWQKPPRLDAARA